MVKQALSFSVCHELPFLVFHLINLVDLWDRRVAPTGLLSIYTSSNIILLLSRMLVTAQRVFLRFLHAGVTLF